MFFSTFDVKGGSDRLLIYLTLYAAQCIKRCQKIKNKKEGEKILYNLANKKVLQFRTKWMEIRWIFCHTKNIKRR